MNTSPNSPEALALYYAWAEEANQSRQEDYLHATLWLMHFSAEGGV